MGGFEAWEGPASGVICSFRFQGGTGRLAAEHSRVGAPLLPPVLAYTVLTLCAVAIPPLIAGLKPWTSDSAQLDFFQHHVGAAHASAFFTLGSAVPFAVATAVATEPTAHPRPRCAGTDHRPDRRHGGRRPARLAGLSTLALTQDRVADSRRGRARVQRADVRRRRSWLRRVPGPARRRHLGRRADRASAAALAGLGRGRRGRDQRTRLAERSVRRRRLPAADRTFRRPGVAARHRHPAAGQQARAARAAGIVRTADLSVVRSAQAPRAAWIAGQVRRSASPRPRRG